VIPQRATRAVIDPDAIRHNLRLVRECVGPDCLIAAVVKADGYGHGLVESARACLDAGADRLCVALVDRAVELRRHLPTVPILVLLNLMPGEEGAVVEHDLTATVEDGGALAALQDEAARVGRRVKAHLKIDTGMSRIGVQPHEAVAFMERTRQCTHVEFEGVYSHFARSDEADLSFAEEQLRRYLAAVDELGRRGFRFALRHMCNSAGVFTMLHAHLDMVRPGMMLYGMRPAPQVELPQRPAMTVLSRVAKVKTVPAGTYVSYGCTHRCTRETIIASIPIGYFDGYRRALSNRFYVRVRGEKAPVLGRVCMNMLMVDVTDVPGVRQGDDVLIFGESEGGRIPVDEMAEAAGTIPQEIVSCISRRVPRVYLGE